MSGFDRRSFLKLAAGSAVAAGGTGWLAQALADGKLKPGPNDVFIVVDVQKCFIPGGSLAVNQGDEIVPLINEIAKKFENVVLTQDWHTADHVSFASQHEGKKPFETTTLKYGQQVLWPDHCVQGTEDAALHKDLRLPTAQLIIRKGFRAAIDSYSAFFENDHSTPTGLDGYLRSRGVTSVTLAGLATDFCVAYSAIDAAGLGYKVTVLEGACRAIDLNGSLSDARAKMRAAGVALEQ